MSFKDATLGFLIGVIASFVLFIEVHGDQVKAYADRGWLQVNETIYDVSPRKSD